MIWHVDFIILLLLLLKILCTMNKNKKIRYELLDNDDDDDLFIIPFAWSFVLNSNMEKEWYVLPHSTHWRCYFFSFTYFLNCEFRDTFRMTRWSFFILHSLLQPYIQKKQTHLRPTISSEYRLAIFLYYVTQGDAYISVSNQFTVSKSTVSNIIGEVSQAIVHHLSSKYIRFSTINEIIRTMEYF